MPSLRIAALVVAALWGCDEQGGPEPRCPEADAGAPCDYAVMVCEDYADVVATAFSDCGLGTYEENLQAFEDNLPAPCAMATDIVGEEELMDVCWPFFQDATCDTLMSPDIADMIPAECRGQLVFPE